MKRIALAIFCLAVAAGSARALTINFTAAAFTIDTNTSYFTTSISQDATGTRVVGKDNGQTLAGTFGPFDLTGVTSLFLTGTLAGANPNSGFTVLLFNYHDISEFRTYSGAFNGYGVISASTSLSAEPGNPAFTDVGGFQLVTNGTGDALDFTFESLSDTAPVIAPVPEPSTALAGVALIALVGASRQRRSSTVRSGDAKQ